MAIAYDTITVNKDTTGRSSASFAHPCTGSDLVLVVICLFRHQTLNPSVSTVTYNGVAATQRQRISYNYTGTRYLTAEVWTLDDPATGSNTVAVTYAQTQAADAVLVISLTGANTYVNGNKASGNSNNPSTSVGGPVSNSWLVGGAAVLNAGNTPFTPGSGSVERADEDNGTAFGLWGATEPTGADPSVFDVTASGTNHWVIAVVEISEVAAVAGQPMMLRATTVPGLRQWQPRV